MINGNSHNSPYKGLQPYTERDRNFFFGRERDQEIITSNLFASSLTVFYGASGVGKSSVLLAGVVPDLRETKRVAVAVFRDWQDTSFETALKSEVLKAIKSDSQKVDPNLELDEFLISCQKIFRGSLFIVLDQFEEYFLYHPPTSEGERFDAAFARAINRDDIGANFLLSMRDDGLSRLDRFQKRIPNLLNNMLRLEHLDRQSGELAIKSPLDAYNATQPKTSPPARIEDDLVKILLTDLRTGNVTLGLTGQGRVTNSPGSDEGRIETPFLQMVLTRLWDEEQRTQQGHSELVLTEQTYRRLGEATDIVRTHLDQAMQTKALRPYQETAAGLFHFLVTPGGMKIAHTVADLTSYTKISSGHVEEALQALSESDVRIVRPVAAPPGHPEMLRYEIFHDVLAPAITSWRLRHQQELEKKKEADEIQAREAEQQRQLLAAQQEAEEERQRAEEQRLLAEALELRADAEKDKVKAEQQKVEAEREISEVLRRRADEQVRSARRFRRLAYVLAVVSLLFVSFAAYGVVKQRQAVQLKTAADAANATAEALQKENQQQAASIQRQAASIAEEKRKSQELIEVSRERKEDADRAEEAARVATATAASERAKAKQARTDAEQAKTAAQNDQLYAEAFRLSRIYSTRPQAIDKFNRALAGYRAASDSAAVTSTLIDMGAVRLDMQETSLAKDAFDEAVRSAVGPAQKGSMFLRIGELYNESSSEEGSELALEAYNRALEIYTSSTDTRGQANAKLGIGQAQNSLAYYKYGPDKQKAVEQSIKAFDEAVVIFAGLNDPANEALALYGAGNTLEASATDEATTRRSIDYYKRALSKYEAAGDRNSQIYTLGKLIDLNTKIRDTATVRLNRLALAEVFRTVRNRIEEANTYLDLASANLSGNDGRPLDETEVVKGLTRAVNLLIESGHESGRTSTKREQAARLLTSIAILFKHRLQRLDEASKAFEAALEAYGDNARPYDVFYALNELVWINRDLRKTQAQRSYLARSQTVAEQISDFRERSNTLLQIGQNFLDLGELNNAKEYLERAIADARQYDSRQLPTGSRKIENETLLEIGKYYAGLSLDTQAREYFARALETEPSAVGKQLTLESIGNAYLQLREYGTAISFYEQALTVIRENNLSPAFEANVLYDLARTYRSRGAEGDNIRAEAAEQHARALTPGLPTPTPQS